MVLKRPLIAILRNNYQLNTDVATAVLYHAMYSVTQNLVKYIEPPPSLPGNDGRREEVESRNLFTDVFRNPGIYSVFKVLCALFCILHSLPFLPLSPLLCKFQNQTATEPLTS